MQVPMCSSCVQVLDKTQEVQTDAFSALEDYEDESGEYVAGIARSSYEITVTDSATDHMVLGGRVVSKADDVESDATCAVRRASQVRIEPSKDTNETANLVIKPISSSKPVPE